MSIMEKLRSMRNELPKGNKDPWGDCCPSKRVLLQRALNRENTIQLTKGERRVINEWLAFCRKVAKENQAFEKEIQKILEK